MSSPNNLNTNSVSECLRIISNALENYDKQQAIFDDVMSLPFIKKLVDEKNKIYSQMDNQEMRELQ